MYGYWEKHGGQDKIKALDSIDFDAWFFGEGTELPVKMEYDLTLSEAAYSLAARWDAARGTTDVSQLGFSPKDLDNFNSNQIIVFLERLQSYAPLPSALAMHLGSVYGFAGTQNAEIRLRYYEVTLADPQAQAAQKIAEDAAKWVTGTDGSDVIKGRMKFCRPTFKAVAKVNRDLAVSSWEGAKTGFHPIARKLIEKVCSPGIYKIIISLTCQTGSGANDQGIVESSMQYKNQGTDPTERGHPNQM